MPDQNSIYNFMKSNNLTDLDEKTFINKYSAPDKAKEIYSFMASNKLTDLDESKFYDKYLKKKVGGAESSLTGLQSKGFSPEQINLLETGAKPPKPSGKAGEIIVPTNITPDQKAYERELKRQDAAINTLKNTYKQKGLNFNEKSKRGQEQIQQLLDKEISNDLTLVTGKDQKPYLVRGEGFLESAGRGVLRSITEPIESTKINFTNDANELADLLDEKIKEEPNVPESAPTRFGGYLGELAGGLPKMMALLAIPVAGESAMVGEMYHNALANQRRALYERGLQEGMDRTMAAQNAMKNAPITAIPDAIVGAAMARGVGGKAAGAEIIPNAAKESFLKATGNGLKGVAKVSGIGGAAEFGRSKTEQQLGYNVTDAEAIENGLRGMGEYAIMDAAFKLAHAGPKYLSSAAKNLLSNVPKEILEVAAEKYPDGKRTLEDVAKFSETKAKVQDFVPEEKVGAVAGLTEKTENIKSDIKLLEERKKDLPEAVASQIDAEIADKNKEVKFYDNQIKKVIESKDITGITEEIDDVTGYKAGEPPVIEEYDLKMGDIITANIGGKEEKGKVIGVGRNKGQIVIDFIDENNNQRFVYGDQIKNIEKGELLIDNLSEAQKERKAELLSKEELTSADLAELDELNKGRTEASQIELPTEKIKPTEVKLTERQLYNREKSRVEDVVERLENSGEIKGSNISVADKDLVDYVIDKGLDGREASVVKDMIERVIKPLKNITDKIDPTEVKFFTENVEDINAVVEGLKDARSSLFSRNNYIVDNVKKEAQRLLDYYSDKNNLAQEKLDTKKTFEAKVDLLKKFLNGDLNYLDLSKFGIEKKLKDYAVQKPSAGRLLQPAQKRVGETGGERKRVEPSVKGEKVTEKGKQAPVYEKEEIKVYNAKDLKSNKDILEEDKDYHTIGYPKSFDRVYTNKEALKSKKLENKKIGDVINIFNKDYVIADFIKDKVELIRVDDNGNLLREQDLKKGIAPKKTYQEALKEKQEAEKKQTRQVAGEKAAASRRIFDRVFKMDAPEDAEQVALRYLADGGKVSKEAIDEAYGSVKRAQLNVKRRELLSEEVKSKDFAGGKETLDEVAHRLWEENGQRISERDIKEALMAEIGNNNTRLEAAEAYLDKYSPEYQLEKEEMRLAEQYKEQYLEEQAKLEEELRKPLDEQIEGEASEEHINNLIKQYEAEIKGEDQQLRSESEGAISAEAGKGEAVKEAPKTEERLAQEYKEVVKKAGKKAKENAKKDFVDRNFDSIVEKLKIQIKCPT